MKVHGDVLLCGNRLAYNVLFGKVEIQKESSYKTTLSQQKHESQINCVAMQGLEP